MIIPLLNSTRSRSRNDDHASNGNSSGDINRTFGRGGRERGRMYGNNRHGRSSYCRNSTEHGWHGCPLRLSPHQQSDKTGGAVGEDNVPLAWCTQEDIAFPAVMETGSSTPLGDTAAAFVDAAASHHIMVPAEPRLCQHVANTINCRVRVKRIVRPL